MSSHYVYVSCDYPECEEYDSIYTGNTELDAFSDSQWEGGTIYALCKAHESGKDEE